MVNGYRFHTKDRERERKTQNSGIVVKGQHGNNIIDFYGVINEIIEVKYWLGKKRVLIFKCDWWKVDDVSGMQIDKDWGITSVNSSRKWYEDQPYVLPDHVQQVFYVEDMKLGKNWYVVEKFNPRNSYDIPEQQDLGEVEEAYQEEEPEEIVVVRDLDEPLSLSREDMIPLKCVDSSTLFADRPKKTSREVEEDFINDDDDMEEDLSVGNDEDEDIWDDDNTDSD